MPKMESKQEERIVEVPHSRVAEKIVEMPKVHIQELDRLLMTMFVQRNVAREKEMEKTKERNKTIQRRREMLMRDVGD